MFCAGETPDKMQQRMEQGMIEYTKKEFDVDAILDIFDTMGIDNADVFTTMIRDFCFEKWGNRDITFKELGQKTGRNLVITGSNISTAKVEYFSIDSCPDMLVVDAIRISISLPFVMKPVIYKDYIYVDASLFNNFPIEYFQQPNNPFQDTIALLLSCPSSKPDAENLNLFKYVRIIIDAMFMRINDDEKKISDVKKNNVVIRMSFPDDNYGFDFENLRLTMDSSKLVNYVSHGYNICKDHLHLHTNSGVNEP
jgi:predicted acylesterase/phospholipase RssA